MVNEKAASADNVQWAVNGDLDVYKRQVCQSAADASDVIYIPTDNTAANNTELINNICYGKVPVVAGEEGICAGCGVATLSISYYDLGVATGSRCV